MKPFRDYDLNKIIANQWNSIRERIDAMSNEEIMANDLEILADNIYQEFYIEPVIILEEDFSKRRIEQGKIRKYVNPVFRDRYESEYVIVDGIVAKFYFPFEGDKVLFQSQASTYSLGAYPEITIKESIVLFCIERSLVEMKRPTAKEEIEKKLEYDLKDIRTGLSYANKDVTSFNNLLKKQVLNLLQEKRNKVEDYYNIATMFEVPIEKREYAQAHIPLERKIVPVAKHYETSNYYGISDKDYKDILDTIKHTGSTYERTPSSYKSLHEEDLRNTLLAALNATYKGDATGETFRNKGKTDICIERENRAAFVGECKMWTGQKDVTKAIEQLDGYLTWRDCKTALIYFVRRKSFMKVLETMKSTLYTIDNMRKVTAIDKNEFECLYISKANPGQHVVIRVMLFNLYCGE